MTNGTDPNFPQLPQPWSIGHTPILEIPELSEHFGLKHLRIKDEGSNYFGTHKDRKSVSVVLEAINRAPHQRPEALCILTAGNAGLSLAKIASFFGLPVTAFVGDRGLSSQLRASLNKICESVIPLDLEGKFWSSDELRFLAGEKDGKRILDSTNGITTPFESIVDEIVSFDEENVPDVIVLPVGSGELFLGVAQGLKKRRLRTRLVGVTVGKESAADKLYSRWNPQAGELLSLLHEESHHSFSPLTNEQMLADTLKLLKNVSAFSCEASSAAAFAALNQLKPGQHERVLVVNTGTIDIERSAP
jgi:cysteine synthase